MATNTDPIDRSNILIVGRSGNGKSSRANSIVHLAENPFPVNRANTCETKNNIYFHDSNNIRVWDCSGMVDVGLGVDNVRHFVRPIIKDAISSGGIDVMVYVLKYGVRFTKQDKDAVERMEYIFGDSIFRDFVIIAFSYGDIFEPGCTNWEESFDVWCKQQTGYAANLFADVKYRCVLFDTKTWDLTKQTDQCEQVFRYIQSAVNKSQPGTLEKEIIYVGSSDERNDDKKKQSYERFVTKKSTFSCLNDCTK